tara:strand:+ start:770 stop:1204 length:435 start_codon:yes stop_codon:yes gene_type:complete
MSGYNTFPRIPLHMQGSKESTPIRKSVAPTVSVGARKGGNDLFRRYPNGVLDVPYVAAKVVEAFQKLQQANLGGHSGFPLTQLEVALLSIIVPGLELMDKRMAKTLLQLSKEEKAGIQDKVKQFFVDMQLWGAGVMPSGTAADK